MEIIVNTLIPYWKPKKSKKVISKMNSDGWILIHKENGFFSTTYSFSKII